MQAGARIGEGRSSRGRNRERPRPTEEAPPRCLPGGEASLLRRLVACSPYPVAPRQRLKSGTWRASPPWSFLPGTGEGGGGRFLFRGRTHRGGPSAAPDVPSPPSIWQLAAPASGTQAAFPASRGLASLPSSSLQLRLPGIWAGGESWSRHVLGS